MDRLAFSGGNGIKAARRCLAAALVTPLSGFAQSPLTIEQLLVDVRQWQATASVDVHASPGTQALLMTGHTWRAGLRYGVSSRLEISAQVEESTIRVEGGGGVLSRSRRRLITGANWLARQEGAWPALLLEANLEWAGLGDPDASRPRAVQWAITGYRSIDPLVLSLTLSRRQSFSSGIAADGADSPGRADSSVNRSGVGGSSTSLLSQLSFAVNPRVTLFSGLALQRESGAAEAFGPRQHRSLSVSAGLALAPTARQTVFVRGQWDSASEIAAASIQWLIDF